MECPTIPEKLDGISPHPEIIRWNVPQPLEEFLVETIRLKNQSKIF